VAAHRAQGHSLERPLQATPTRSSRPLPTRVSSPPPCSLGSTQMRRTASGSTTASPRDARPTRSGSGARRGRAASGSPRPSPGPGYRARGWTPPESGYRPTLHRRAPGTVLGNSTATPSVRAAGAWLPTPTAVERTARRGTSTLAAAGGTTTRSAPTPATTGLQTLKCACGASSLAWSKSQA
jgi:hypothetical protein